MSTTKSYVGLYPNDARLEMFARSCHQPDLACSADWVWTKKTIFGRSSGEIFHYCGEMPAD